MFCMLGLDEQKLETIHEALSALYSRTEALLIDIVTAKVDYRNFFVFLNQSNLGN